MKKRIYGISVVVAVLSMAMIGIVSADTDANGVKINHINIQDFAFTPQTIVIQKGEWAQFENKMNNTDFDIRFVNSNIRLYDIAKYKSYGHKFDEVGIYEYYCAIHPGMLRGKIIVIDTPSVTPTPSVTVTPVTGLMNIVSWRNSWTNDQQFKMTVPVGSTVLFTIVTNYDTDSYYGDNYGDTTIASRVMGFSGLREIWGSIRFDKPGITLVKVGSKNNTYGEAHRTWNVSVSQASPVSTYNPITERYPLPNSTFNGTSTPTQPVSTYSPTPVITYSPTPVITYSPTLVIDNPDSWTPTQGESCWSSVGNLGRCSGHVLGQFVKGFTGGLWNS